MSPNTAYQRGIRSNAVRVVGRGGHWYVYAGIRPVTHGDVYQAAAWVARLQVLEGKHGKL